MEVRIKKLNENAVIPSYSKPGDAGMDLTATSKEFDKFGNVVYGTGLAIEIPEGYVGLIFPRSSICKQDLSLTNAVGVIDSGYRGEIIAKFKPTNTFFMYDDAGQRHIEHKAFCDTYNVGDRICQLIIIPYPNITFIETDVLSGTERGIGGFGHTGV